MVPVSPEVRERRRGPHRQDDGGAVVVVNAATDGASGRSTALQQVRRESWNLKNCQNLDEVMRL